MQKVKDEQKYMSLLVDFVSLLSVDRSAESTKVISDKLLSSTSDIRRVKMDDNPDEDFVLVDVTGPLGGTLVPFTDESYSNNNASIMFSTPSPSTPSRLSYLGVPNGNFTSEGRGKRLNLTMLNLDLSAMFPSLEAVSKDVQAFLIVIYSLAAVMSLVGNVTVILVLAFGRRSSVRGYLINLAIADITMAAFCIPFSYTSFMFHRWIFAPEFCRIAAFMQHVSVTCSVYTLVAIGVDRYKALIHPLNIRWTKSRARYVISGIWVFSLVISIVPLVVSDAQRFYWDGEWYYECKENWPITPNEVYEKTYTVLLFVLTFAMPVIGLGYTYLSIVGMMCSYKMPGNAEPSRDQQHLQAKVKVINMMITVMVCFVLCWFPLQVLQFLIYFAPEITTCRGHGCFPYYMSFFACHWLAMANSFMNPFIYCFMSKNFREDLLQFLKKCNRKKIQRHRSNDLGSSFRSILYITHKTSVQSSSKMSFRARSDRSREADVFELKPIQHRKSPSLTRSKGSTCDERRSSLLRNIRLPGKNDRQLGSGQPAMCLRDNSPNIYVSPVNNTVITPNHNNSYQHRLSWRSHQLNTQAAARRCNSSSGKDLELPTPCTRGLLVMNPLELRRDHGQDLSTSEVSNNVIVSNASPTLEDLDVLEHSECSREIDCSKAACSQGTDQRTEND